jgi:hypothetical protein
MEKDKTAPRAPGPLKHPTEVTAEPELQKQQRGFLAANPGARFLVDVVTALHAPAQPMRDARAFHAAFSPQVVLQAFAARAELRVRLVRAITGGPPALLRRMAAEDLAKQVELLVAEDLPVAERSLRAEEDRALDVFQLYQKYLDPGDLASYLPSPLLWQYESQDQWWTRAATPASRALMTAELKSIRAHAILSDGEILDLLGDETLERDLPVAVRTRLRSAARRAGREGKAFRDVDLFSALRSDDGKQDLTDHLVEHVAAGTLRKVVARAAEVLGLAQTATAEQPIVEVMPAPPREATPAPIREAPAPQPSAAPQPRNAASQAKGGSTAKLPAAVTGKTPKRNLTPVGGAEELPPEPVEFLDPENWLATIDEAG